MNYILYTQLEFTLVQNMGGLLNPNVANPHRQKSLGSRSSTPSAAVLASARISRTVKYASDPTPCGCRARGTRACAARRSRSATLGLTLGDSTDRSCEFVEHCILIDPWKLSKAKVLRKRSKQVRHKATGIDL
jgi:hypothetical protein